MNKTDVQNLIKELIERTGVSVTGISIMEGSLDEMHFKVEVPEPHLFVSHEGEGLNALNHLVRKMLETKLEENVNILIDIDDFQKKRIENVQAVAHMMAERARYFKSNIEVDPMSSFERRIVHEFLSDASDLTTESVGFGPTRRVVIKYTGEI